MDITKAEAWDWGKDSIGCVVNKTLWLGLIFDKKEGVRYSDTASNAQKTKIHHLDDWHI